MKHLIENVRNDQKRTTDVFFLIFCYKRIMHDDIIA